jgi:hypothetical protein
MNNLNKFHSRKCQQQKQRLVPTHDSIHVLQFETGVAKSIVCSFGTKSDVPRAAMA